MNERPESLSGAKQLPESEQSPDARASAIDRSTTNVWQEDAKLIAFYLPQFHRVAENSEWWGPGFTEWNNVARATPNFVGHNQPRIPRELGYYDLSRLDAIQEQIEMARIYGVSGFCFYHYWFSGRKILDKPVNLFINSPLEFDFCMCWANENWTRTWDGDNKDILLEQNYAKGDAEAFIDDMLTYFRDRRYIKVNGEPLLIVYRAKEIPDPQSWFAIWRERVVAAGFPGLHISVVDHHEISSPQRVGADSLLEFPPHKYNGPQNAPAAYPSVSNPNFSGGILDYTRMIAQSANRPTPSFTLFRGIIPGWDNTARRQNNPTIVINSTPALYGEWLRFLRFQAKRQQVDPDRRLIFINAWNEWGEGCYLEPDQLWGLSYLEETLRGNFPDAASEPTEIEAARSHLFEAIVGLAGNETESPGLSKTSLSTIMPPSTMAFCASAALRQWPRTHSVAKQLYLRWARRWQRGNALGHAGALIDPANGELSTRHKPRHAEIAVVLHLYYFDMAREIYRLLENIILPFDLHITIPLGFETSHIVSLFSKLAKNVFIHPSENRGRDIGAFVSLYRSGVLDRYDAVLKIHSKKSAYSKKGPLWRDRLFRSVAGDSLTVLRSIELVKSGKAGIVGPHQFYLTNNRFWGTNRGRVGRLLKELDRDDLTDGPQLGFFAGSMFWFTPRALIPLKNIAEADLIFEPENGQQDGTLAHAFERLFCILARGQGFTASSVPLGGREIHGLVSPDNEVPVL